MSSNIISFKTQGSVINPPKNFISYSGVQESFKFFIRSIVTEVSFMLLLDKGKFGNSIVM